MLFQSGSRPSWHRESLSRAVRGSPLCRYHQRETEHDRLRNCPERIMMRSSMQPPALVLAAVPGRSPAIPLLAARYMPGQARKFTVGNGDLVLLSSYRPRGHWRATDATPQVSR